jgi:hypothetical protein
METVKSRRTLTRTLGTALVAVALIATPLVAAQAYNPTGGVMYELPSSEPCLKGRGNCVVYPKSAQLPDGTLVAAFEKATVVDYPAPDTIGGAVGETLPIWKSDDFGTTWQPLSEVPSPAALSNDPAVDKYSSNWTNPYLYVLPQNVGNLSAGTLLLASVVSGEDEYFRERKAADPNWVPSNDGDRRDVAIALFASTNSGVTWTFVNIVATGGWQGGSAGAGGVNVSNANVYDQVDPVWEPHLVVIDGQLVAYYSDENDYLGYNATSGVPTIDPNNGTAPDSRAQILVHRTWNGVSTSWSAPVVDVAGDTFSWNGGQQIGGGRPGMTTIAETTGGDWYLTFEYFGGGQNVRYKLGSDPLQFFADGDGNGNEIGQLPVDSGSRPLATGGSPVLIELPDGRIAYNSAGSGSIWLSDGATGGTWTEYQTTLGSGYSRNLQYVEGTGRVLILQATWGAAQATPLVRFADVDLGHSEGAYVRIVNELTGQVVGTGNNTNDANLGNGNVPDVRLETAGSASNGATQYWHLQPKPSNSVTLLNQSGGRAAAIWTGTATAGQRIGQWVDDVAIGQWTTIDNGDGTVSFRSTANTSLFLTGASANAALTLETARTDGSQDWDLVEEPVIERIVNRNSAKCLDVNAWSTSNGGNVQQWTCSNGANQQWRVQPLSGGYVQIVNEHSGLCLDVSTASTANGANVQQWACTGGTNQQWTVGSLAGGYVQFVNRNSGRCLDVNAWSTANGGNVQQWACTGGANQQWQRVGI